MVHHPETNNYNHSLLHWDYTVAGIEVDEKKIVLKRIIWKEYDKYCMYLTREDLARIGGWLKVQVPSGLSKEAVFDHLYQSVGLERFAEALNREAEERMIDRENLLAQLGGGGEAFKQDITKLQAFIAAVRNLI